MTVEAQFTVGEYENRHPQRRGLGRPRHVAAAREVQHPRGRRAVPPPVRRRRHRSSSSPRSTRRRSPSTSTTKRVALAASLPLRQPSSSRCPCASACSTRRTRRTSSSTSSRRASATRSPTTRTSPSRRTSTCRRARRASSHPCTMHSSTTRSASTRAPSSPSTRGTPARAIRARAPRSRMQDFATLGARRRALAAPQQRKAPAASASVAAATASAAAASSRACTRATTKDTLGDDLVFRAAPPIVGGREMRTFGDSARARREPVVVQQLPGALRDPPPVDGPDRLRAPRARRLGRTSARATALRPPSPRRSSPSSDAKRIQARRPSSVTDAATASRPRRRPPRRVDARRARRPRRRRSPAARCNLRHDRATPCPFPLARFRRFSLRRLDAAAAPARKETSMRAPSSSPPLLAPSRSRPAARAFCGFYVRRRGQAALQQRDPGRAHARRHAHRALDAEQLRGPAREASRWSSRCPVVLQKENVKTLPREVFAKLEQLDAPRLVEYWEQDPCAQRTQRARVQEDARAPMQRPQRRWAPRRRRPRREDRGAVQRRRVRDRHPQRGGLDGPRHVAAPGEVQHPRRRRAVPPPVRAAEG